MTHKISGTVEESSRLIVLDESDFSTLEYNDTVSGTYDVTVASGSKTVIIRSADGESFGYGAVASKDDGVVESIGGINSGTWLCTHLDEFPFVDSSLTPFAIINQAVVMSSTQSKFGGYAGYFSGAETQRLILSRDINITASDFTIDFWIYLTNRKTSQMLLYHYYNSTNFWRLYLTASSNVLRFESKINGSTNILVDVDNSYLDLNSWHHIALERYGNLYSVFIDGNLRGSVIAGSNPYYHSTKYMYAGGNGVLTGYDYTGYMDEIRVSQYAAYEGQPFTPPPIAYSVE
jgi:hypothetical protein